MAVSDDRWPIGRAVLALTIAVIVSWTLAIGAVALIGTAWEMWP